MATSQTQLLSIILSHSESQRRSSRISRHFQPRLFHDHPSTPQPPRLFDVDDQQNDQTPSSDSSNPPSISAQNHRPDIIRVSNDAGENRMKGFAGTKNVIRAWLPQQKQDGPVGLNGVTHDFDSRIALLMSGTFGVEVARVLDGGIVPGSLILIGGDPGVGKSTLSLPISTSIAESCDVGGAAPVLYISGEEDILRQIQFLSPCAVVIDSIQTGYLKGVTGCPGGLVQVKKCAAALNHFSKKTNIPVILV